MVITEVRIKLMDENNERLQAFCSVTFDDCFVIRDLKIIEGTKGSFVAMPSRKLTDRCTGCGSKNHLRARHCNQCGTRLDENRAIRDTDGRAKLHADIAHPINSTCRSSTVSFIGAIAFRRLARRGHICHDLRVALSIVLGVVIIITAHVIRLPGTFAFFLKRPNDGALDILTAIGIDAARSIP